MKTVSGNHHLVRRNGVYYFRRRVPRQLVKSIGCKTIQFSLGTTSLKEAKKLRAAKDIEWDARFDACEQSAASSGASSGNCAPSGKAPALSEQQVIRLVHEYVERMDERSRKRFAGDPPESEQQKADMKMYVEIEAQI